MSENPKATTAGVKYKFALIGTSCSGKTTTAYALTSRLKSYGILADGVFSQDRKFSFDKKHLLTKEIAQQWMVNNLISKETDTILHDDIDVLITDRSALDLMAYYVHQFPTSVMMQSMLEYVLTYLGTYTKLYYMKPLPYQDDNKRPNDEFRMAVDRQLRSIIESDVPLRLKDRICFLEPSKILEDVLLTIGHKKPSVKTRLTRNDMQFLANVCSTTLLMKHSSFEKAEDVLSDNDVFMLEPCLKQTLVDAVRRNFGPWVVLDVICLDAGCPFNPAEFSVFSPEPLDLKN